MGTTDDGGAGDERGIVGQEEKILVSVRLRPLNEKEIARNDVCDWECVNESTIVFKNRNLPVLDRSMYPTAYTFDKVFGSGCATKQVYEEGAKEVALSVLRGINSTLFAYGQTSSGKTYTMTGITEYTIADIFYYIEKRMEREYHLKLSAMEIYNESVRDLLSMDGSPLRLLDDPERGTVVEKLIEEPIRDWNHVMELLSICEAQRQIGETALNEASSRSHQIIRLTIVSSPREFLSKDSSSTLVASVNFVDLAGSERASQSLSAGTRLKEGCHINRSLLTLGTVIRKLSKGRNGHIPFRDSKLTRILQSSLGGNARTAIICTMSPARSLVEQSRNTLLFASCAKEVTTNAQVNVIMSDKALVKHLQRELARLESELRSPGSTFAMHYSALLQDKDLQIEKLEKEVMDLTLQRDFAKSQVQDLLRLVGEDGDSMVGLNDYPHLRIRKSPEYENTISERSLSADPHSLDIGVRMFDRATYAYVQNADSPDDHYVRLSDYEESYQLNGNSPHILVSTSQFIRSNSEQSWNGIEEQTDGISEDLCKEVRCIETEESSTDHLSESNVSCPVENGTDKELVSLPIKEDKELNFIVPFIAPSPEKLSSWPSANYTCSSGTFKLTKSRSCKASLMTSPRSLWFSKVENNENTPPNGFEKDFTGRPEGIQRKLSELKYEADTESKEAGSMNRAWSKSSQSSVGTAAALELEALKDKTSSDENISSVNACVTQMEGEVSLQKEEQVVQCPVQTVEVKSEESFKNVKDVGLDPIEDDSNSLSDWALEFKRIQGEIIKLWDDCNVSLVHRTYFFLLFKGDPSDSIYMEVELRRLSFLKDTFSRGNKTMDRGRTLSPASSLKALCREREKLAKQMLKRLSEQDRESLYLKWGIKINSKNRRLQLAYCLWTNTEDMDHIANSAFLVAKLVGIVEPGQAPKEMFGLNFAPQPPKDLFYSLKQSVASLL